MNKVIRPRRLFVSGGSRLSENAALLWKELGSLLAMEDGLVVITGGLGGRVDYPGTITADHMIIDGMLPVLRKRKISSRERIETVLPDPSNDKEKLNRIKEGNVITLQRRNAQSRRFSMVHSSDVVISVEGERGTRTVLDVALAIERPVLPVPFGKGISREVWIENCEDIQKWFRIEKKEKEEFEKTRIETLEPAQISELAKKIHTCLMRGFTKGCFVIMRFSKKSDPVFDEAIMPALEAQGFQPWRTDRTVTTGDVVTAIRNGIRHCSFAIADTTGDSPNVMYELGMAHAENKPVILLRRLNPDGSLPKPPFDFQSHSIIGYDENLDRLRDRLETGIAVMTGRLQVSEDETKNK